MMLFYPVIAMGQTTIYYKFTKKIQNGIEYTNTAGGQFISFLNGTCYDSDKWGISVGNGHLVFEEQYSNSSKTYIGNSYFGKVVYRFKNDLSLLNIIVSENLVYVYKRTTAPSNQTTCSLIRKKNRSKTSADQSSQRSVNIDTYDNLGVNLNALDNNTNTSRQKTKVRKQCAYCSGKGERIQHEYVSTFGLDGPRVYCRICNQSWSYGTVHVHHKCNHCNGSGYYEYEY